ncbi:hypothetical protein HG530_003800 [Fusarium avenaceum]|nr:hypothetical protein HG530_003800 [Fusarium avenaceum]
MTNNSLGQSKANTKEHKDGPFPSEWIDNDTEEEPPDKLQIRKEVKSASWAGNLEHLGHVNPALHPERTRTRKRVHEKHEEDSRVDTNVPVAHAADGVDFGGGRPLEAGCHYDNVGVDDFFMAWTTLRNTFGTSINEDSAIDDLIDIATDPFGLALAELIHDI